MTVSDLPDNYVEDSPKSGGKKFDGSTKKPKQAVQDDDYLDDIDMAA